MSKVVIRKLDDSEAVPAGEPRRYLDGRGYIRLRWRVAPGQYVECYEHRLVAGRPPSGAAVHHKNGVKYDNRPCNLEVLTPAEHAAHHASERRLDDAEVARLYGEGLTQPEVADALGCNPGAVSRSLARSGAEVRPRARAVSGDVLRDAIALHAAGLGYGRIARVLGVGRLPVDLALRDEGRGPQRPGTPTRADLAAQRSAVEAMGLTWR